MSFLISAFVFLTESLAQKDTKESSYLIFDGAKNSYEKEKKSHTRKNEPFSHGMITIMIPELSTTASDQNDHSRTQSQTENHKQSDQSENRIAQFHSGFSKSENLIKMASSYTKNNGEGKITQEGVLIHVSPKKMVLTNLNEMRVENTEFKSHSERNELDEREPEFLNRPCKGSDANNEVQWVQYNSSTNSDFANHRTMNDTASNLINEIRKLCVVSQPVNHMNDDMMRNENNQSFENLEMENKRSDKEENLNIYSDDSSGYESIEEDLAYETGSELVKSKNSQESRMQTDLNLLKELHRAEIQKIRKSYIEYQKANEEKLKQFYQQVILKLLRFDWKAKSYDKNKTGKKVDTNGFKLSKNHMYHEQSRNELATLARPFQSTISHSSNKKPSTPSYMIPMLYHQKKIKHKLSTISECQEPVEEPIFDFQNHIHDIKMNQENGTKMQDNIKRIEVQSKKDMNSQTENIYEKKHTTIESATKITKRENEKIKDFFDDLNNIQKNVKLGDNETKDSIHFNNTIIINLNKHVFSALQYLLSSFAGISKTNKTMVIVSDDKVPVKILRDDFNLNRFVLDTFNDAGQYFLDSYYIDQAKNYSRKYSNTTYFSQMKEKYQSLANMNRKFCTKRKNEDQSEKHTKDLENYQIKNLEKNMKNRKLKDIYEKFHAFQDSLTSRVN